jgi:hypothetical protein
MGIRAFVTITSIVSSVVSGALVGVLTVACSRPSERPSESRPSEPRPPSSLPSTPGEPAPPAPGVSWLRVVPEQGAPGSAVSLDVACLDNLGAVHSPVLTIGALRGNPNGHQPWHLFGLGTVRSDAAPGRYQISTTCGAAELSAPFTVLPARR